MAAGKAELLVCALTVMQELPDDRCFTSCQRNYGLGPHNCHRDGFQH
jgi:hypothetical protein